MWKLNGQQENEYGLDASLKDLLIRTLTAMSRSFENGISSLVVATTVPVLVINGGYC